MSVFKLNLMPETVELIKGLAGRVPEFKRLKAEARERAHKERQCTEPTQKGARCEAWAVHGDSRCRRHGGVKTEDAFCECRAYDFPHRRRSGNCNHPNEPLRKHTTAAHRRKSRKRQKKLRIRKWLKEIGA